MTARFGLNEAPNITFFGDASSKDDTFMVAGGFAIAGTRIAEIDAQIESFRTDAGMQSEFHWSRYRGGYKKEIAYRNLVDYAFDLTRRKHAAFHVIITRFAGYDHKRGRGENRDTSVNRMYYQLCLHRVTALYGHARQIHLRFDAGNDSEDICGMRNELCADAFKRFSGSKGCRPNCVRSIQSMDSRSSNIIQMADVVIGGIAALRNNKVHSGAKGPLALHVLKASGRPNWSVNTGWSARWMTVWNHKTKGTP